jgi:ABC-type proline/glycine betaine transport system permease subunit
VLFCFVCYQQRNCCFNGQHDVCSIKCIYNFVYVLVGNNDTKKVVSSYTDFDKNKAIVVLGSSFVGALVFTFSDSFWYNAVEAEVYAMAMLFIALLLWLGLRWEQDMNTLRGNRWLLLISLIIGLSFGVHFMALLAIPSVGFLYFFKNYKTVTIKIL